MSAVASLVTGTATSRLIAEETRSPAPATNSSRTSSRIALTKIAIIMLAIPKAKAMQRPISSQKMKRFFKTPLFIQPLSFSASREPEPLSTK